MLRSKEKFQPLSSFFGLKEDLNKESVIEIEFLLIVQSLKSFSLTAVGKCQPSWLNPENSNKDTMYSGSEWGEFIFSVAGFLKQKNWVKKNVTK